MIIQPLPTTRTFTGWAVGKYMPSPLLSNCINKLWSKYFVRLGKKITWLNHMLVQFFPCPSMVAHFSKGLLETKVTTQLSETHFKVCLWACGEIIWGSFSSVLYVYHIISLVLVCFTRCHHKHSSSSCVVSHFWSPNLRSHSCLLLLLIIWLKNVSELNHLE